MSMTIAEQMMVKLPGSDRQPLTIVQIGVKMYGRDTMSRRPELREELKETASLLIDLGYAEMVMVLNGRTVPGYRRTKMGDREAPKVRLGSRRIYQGV